LPSLSQSSLNHPTVGRNQRLPQQGVSAAQRGQFGCTGRATVQMARHPGRGFTIQEGNQISIFNFGGSDTLLNYHGLAFHFITLLNAAQGPLPMPARLHPTATPGGLASEFAL
jgi:hypothetical protein